MTQNTTEKNGGSTNPSKRSAPLESQGGMAALSSAYAEFMRRVEQSKAKLQQRYAEEYVNYGNTIAAAQREVEESLQRAAGRYADELKQAWDSNELVARTMKAYQRFGELLEQLGQGEPLQREVGGAYEKFLQSLSMPEGEADADQALQAYLAAIEKTAGRSETLKQAAQAHAEYLVLLKQLHKERGQRLQEAYAGYVKTISEAPSAADFAARAEAAAEAALTSLQQAWRETSDECHQASEAAARSIQSLAEAARSSSQQH